MQETRGYYNTFVVKIWRDEAEGIMRGHIQHVTTQEYAYFLSLENMTNFIVSHLGPPPSDLGTQDKIEGEATLLAKDFGDLGHDKRTG